MQALCHLGCYPSVSARFGKSGKGTEIWIVTRYMQAVCHLGCYPMVCTQFGKSGEGIPFLELSLFEALKGMKKHVHSV